MTEAAVAPGAVGGRPPPAVAREVTRVDSLACRHCRATAQHRVHPAELTHEEGRAFVADLAAGFPGAVLILTGGEPLTRADTLGLAAEATASEYRTLCGGCRARAYAASDDPPAEEPDCAHEPRGYRRLGAGGAPSAPQVVVAEAGGSAS